VRAALVRIAASVIGDFAAGRARRELLFTQRFREIDSIGYRTIRRYDVGDDIGKHDFRDIERLSSEQDVALVDEVQDRPYDDTDDQRAPRNTPRDAIAPVLFP